MVYDTDWAVGMTHLTSGYLREIDWEENMNEMHRRIEYNIHQIFAQRDEIEIYSISLWIL